MVFRVWAAIRHGNWEVQAEAVAAHVCARGCSRSPGCPRGDYGAAHCAFRSPSSRPVRKTETVGWVHFYRPLPHGQPQDTATFSFGWRVFAEPQNRNVWFRCGMARNAFLNSARSRYVANDAIDVTTPHNLKDMIDID